MKGSVYVGGGRWDDGDVIVMDGLQLRARGSISGLGVEYLVGGIPGSSAAILTAGTSQDQDWAGAAGLPHTLFLADTGTGAGTAGSTEFM